MNSITGIFLWLLERQHRAFGFRVLEYMMGWGKESMRAVKWDIIAFTSLAQ